MDADRQRDIAAQLIEAANARAEEAREAEQLLMDAEAAARETDEHDTQQEAFERKVREAGDYVQQHAITPDEWYRRFKDLEVYRELERLADEALENMDDDPVDWPNTDHLSTEQMYREIGFTV